MIPWLLLGILPQEAQPVPVERTDLEVRTELTGILSPAEVHRIEIRLEALQIPLRVVWAAGSGKPVDKGEEILVLEATQAKRVLEAARDELREAEAALADARREAKREEAADALSLAEAEDKLARAREALQTWQKTERRIAQEAAELAALTAQDRVDDLEEELKQLLDMYRGEELTKASAEIVVRRAQRRLARAKMSLEHAKEQARITVSRLEYRDRDLERAVRNAEFDLDRTKARVERQALKRELGLRRAERDVAEKQERLEKLQADLDRLVVRAPEAGILVAGEFRNGKWLSRDEMEQRLRPGEVVPAGKVLMVIIPDQPLRLRIQVPQDRLEGLREGIKASVTPESQPGRSIDATLQQPLLPVSEDGTAVVEAVLAEKLPPDMAGIRGRIQFVRTLKYVLAIPESAVIRQDGKTLVRLPDGTREVRLGEASGGMVRVLEGLSEQDRVVPK